MNVRFYHNPLRWTGFRQFSCWMAWLLPLALFTSSLPAGEPTEQVKRTANEILEVLRHSKWTASTLNSQQVDDIHRVIHHRFDWTAISQGCLGRHWTRRTASEKQEFQSLLEAFLRRNYTEKIASNFTNLLEVKYLDEKVIDNYAMVRTKLVTQKNDLSIEFRLRQNAPADPWKVYDALIEGVSLVKNYRVQFDEIINSGSYEELVRRLKKRIEEAHDPQAPL